MAEHDDEGQRDDEGQAAEDVSSAQFEMFGGRLNRKWSRSVFSPRACSFRLSRVTCPGFGVNGKAGFLTSERVSL